MKVDSSITTLNMSPSLAEGVKVTLSDTARRDDTRPAVEEVVLDESLKRAVQERKKENTKREPEVAREIYKYHAIFAVDDDKNVVVRLVDKKGKTIQQFPPDEYLQMKKHFRENVKNLFNIEA